MENNQKGFASILLLVLMSGLIFMSNSFSKNILGQLKVTKKREVKFYNNILTDYITQATDCSMFPNNGVSCNTPELLKIYRNSYAGTTIMANDDKGNYSRIGGYFLRARCTSLNTIKIEMIPTVMDTSNNSNWINVKKAGGPVCI